MAPPIKNILGQKFGLLTAIEHLGGSDWLFHCECGIDHVATSSNARQMKSCGHLRSNKYEHALTRARWQSMKYRIEDPRCGTYLKYGGAGITIHPRWQIFENFLEDMGPCPSRDYTLDRYPDREGNYEPGNCRWATRSEQRQNQKQYQCSGCGSYDHRRPTCPINPLFRGRGFNICSICGGPGHNAATCGR